MKNKTTKLVTLFLCLAAMNSSAQTNTFPASGNVGIGTTTPVFKVHIMGTGLISQDSSAVGGRISFRNTMKTGTDINNWTIYNMTTPYAKGLHFWKYYGTNYGTAPTSVMIIGDNGNVGIGTGSTTAPADKLEVRTSAQNEGISIKYGDSWAQFFGGGLTAGAYGTLAKLGDAGIVFGGKTVGTNHGFVIAPWSSTDQNGFRINENGTVTIGTVSSAPNPAGYNLYVNNGILTEKVKVAVSGSAQWADYVFHQEYKLLSLTEVEKYIQQNKHLPNIPSAEEMVKEGNDLGATDARLLAKIEELTLYLIEMKKENGSMLKQIEHLTSEVNSLKKSH